jgi:hypothetical protein
MLLRQRPFRRAIGAALAAAATVACSSGTGPGDDRLASFSVAAAGSPEGRKLGATSPPTVRVSEGRIEVVGIALTPNPCYDVSASTARDGQRITLTLRARANSAVCIQPLGGLAYRAAIADLAPGTYHLSVVHPYTEPDWKAGEVLARDVTVP